MEPVKDTLRTARWAIMATVASFGGSGSTTLTTPVGVPQRAIRSTTYRAVSGVCGAGFSTTVQPAASAGAILRVAMAAGKFHGVMSRHTPTGSGSTMMRLSPAGAWRISPATRTASSLNQRKNSAA